MRTFSLNSSFIDLLTSIALDSIYKCIPCGSTGVLQCKIASLILITVPEHSLTGDERIASQNEVLLGLFILKHMWGGDRLHQQPERYSKYATTLLDNRVATLRTRIKVYPSPTQETLRTQREKYICQPSEGCKHKQQGQIYAYLRCQPLCQRGKPSVEI